MIIKDNFNKTNANPLTDYDSIGQGSHNLTRELDQERRGFIRSNMDNKILDDLRNSRDETEDRDEDDWKMFR